MVSGKLRFTRSWLLLARAFSLDAMRPDDIVWIYKQVTQHRTNGVPTGKTYAVFVWDRHGVIIEIGGKEQGVEEMLRAIYERSPWCIVGFSPDIQRIWNSDRQGFVASVDQRRLGQAVPQ